MKEKSLIILLIFRAVQSAYITEKLTMENTQIVTKLQPRMTREQLIDSARKTAPLLPAAYGWMVNELATRLELPASRCVKRWRSGRSSLSRTLPSVKTSLVGPKSATVSKSATLKPEPTCTCWKLNVNFASFLL